MTKTIWIDFEESAWNTGFTTWLNNNYTAAEIWETYDGQREVIYKEYDEFRRRELEEYIKRYFEVCEIRV